MAARRPSNNLKTKTKLDLKGKTMHVQTTELLPKTTRLGATPDHKVLRRPLQLLADHLRRRRHMRHLESLPDYLLRDIGLTRAEIRKIA